MRKNVTTQKGFVALKKIMKKVLMHLSCSGAMPKKVTQKVYKRLKLKEI